MPWSADAPGHGFTSGTPWLPFGDDHAALSVDRQSADAQSLLRFTRRALAFRNQHPALRWGAIEIVEVDEAKLVFDRVRDGSRLRCAFNLSAQHLPHRCEGSIFATGMVERQLLGPYAANIEVL
jgi:alpha-glucosidase